MALFKSLRGKRENLPSTKTDGYAYFCTDDGTFWIDYKDENGSLQRKQLNAKDAETLLGASLSTVLNSSEVEIPTSKAVKDYVDSMDIIENPTTKSNGNTLIYDGENWTAGDLYYSRCASTPFISISLSDMSDSSYSFISKQYEVNSKLDWYHTIDDIDFVLTVDGVTKTKQEMIDSNELAAPRESDGSIILDAGKVTIALNRDISSYDVANKYGVYIRSSNSVTSLSLVMYQVESSLVPEDVLPHASKTSTGIVKLGSQANEAAPGNHTHSGLESSLSINNNALSLPSAKDWRSMAYSGGAFVVVANNSMNYAYSNNGTVWTESTLPTSGAYNTVAFGNGKFIVPVPNSTKIYYSTDGQSWSTTQAPVSANWTCSCYASGKFVILSNGTDAIYSSDGITWTATTLPVSGNWVDITYDTPHSKFSAVGQDSNNAIYSSDGITWSKATLPLSAKWTCIASNSSKVIALNSGSDSEAYSNSGGFIWMKSDAPKNTTWSSMCYGDGKLVAIAKGSTDAAYSTDGTNWILATMPQSASWCDIIYDGTKFIAIANNNTCVAYSDNGMSWECGSGIIQTNAGEDVTESIKEILGIGGGIDTLSLSVSNWTGTESPYSQIVAIEGVTENSRVDLQPTAEQLNSLATNRTILNTANDNGTVTVYAVGNKPTEDYTMQATITEV